MFSFVVDSYTDTIVFKHNDGCSVCRILYASFSKFVAFIITQTYVLFSSGFRKPLSSASQKCYQIQRFKDNERNTLASYGKRLMFTDTVVLGLNLVRK